MSKTPIFNKENKSNSGNDQEHNEDFEEFILLEQWHIRLSLFKALEKRCKIKKKINYSN